MSKYYLHSRLEKRVKFDKRVGVHIYFARIENSLFCCHLNSNLHSELCVQNSLGWLTKATDSNQYRLGQKN